MARVTVEDCLENVESHFELTVLASKRAKQLLAGKPEHAATIDTTTRRDKETVIALREIAAKTVRVVRT